MPGLAFVSALVFGMPFFGAFLLLLLRRRGDLDPPHLWGYILAGSWILLAPGLISLWDHRIGNLVAIIATAPKEDGWRVDLLKEKCVIARRMLPWVAFLFVAAIEVHFVKEYPFYQNILSVGPRWSKGFWLGLLSVGFMAWTFAVGVWGVFKTMSFVQVICDEGLRFEPYEYGQIPGVEYATTTFYLTGLYFSLGNVLTPAVLVNFFTFDLTGQAIAVIVLLCLELGGAACFLFTSLRMSGLAQHQTARSVNRFAKPLERWAREIESGNLGSLSADRDVIESVVLLRGAALELAASPMSLNILRRTAVLLLVPATLSLIQPLFGLLMGSK